MQERNKSESTVVQAGKKYGVWAEVSGGITGSRQGWLKSQGSRKVFDTLFEAQQEADELNRIMNDMHKPTVRFRYTAKQID
jgi:hypothetical protein